MKKLKCLKLKKIPQYFFPAHNKTNKIISVNVHNFKIILSEAQSFAAVQ